MQLVFDIVNKKWSLIDDGIYFEIFFHFSENGNMGAEFDNLSFGLDIMENNETVLTVSYPEFEGKSYISTDYNSVERLNILHLNKNIEQKFNVWAKNAGVKTKDTFSYTLPKPESPYPSWGWSNEEQRWMAPKPEPIFEDETIYYWDEDLLEWVIVEDIEEHNRLDNLVEP